MSPTRMAMWLLLIISTLKAYAVYTTDAASAFFSTLLGEEVFVQLPTEFYHNRPSALWAMKKALYGLRASPKQWHKGIVQWTQKQSNSEAILGVIQDAFGVLGQVNAPIFGKILSLTTWRGAMHQLFQDPRTTNQGRTTQQRPHSLYRTAVAQLLWVSPLRADIAYAVKELNRSHQCPDEIVI
eukprot:59108-Amphidinium_carterae.3